MVTQPPSSKYDGVTDNCEARCGFPGQAANIPANPFELELGTPSGVEAGSRQSPPGRRLDMNIIQVKSPKFRSAPEFLSGGGEMGFSLAIDGVVLHGIWNLLRIVCPLPFMLSNILFNTIMI